MPILLDDKRIECYIFNTKVNVDLVSNNSSNTVLNVYYRD